MSEELHLNCLLTIKVYRKSPLLLKREVFFPRPKLVLIVDLENL